MLPLGRGFYAGTFLAESGSLGQQDVLKIAPVGVYEKFDKDFLAECRAHKEVAEASEHLVPIRDAFDASVSFGDVDIACHVAVLEYVHGQSLSEFERDDAQFNARAVAQIAIDLFRLLEELESRKKFHNDLHNDNIRIRHLPPNARRADAIDDSVRAVAIDLGSIGDASKSDPSLKRLGDIHEVAGHLLGFSKRLLTDPASVDDDEYRLAHALDEIAHSIASGQAQARTSFDDCIRQIRDAAHYAASPWRSRTSLAQFKEGFNAQTISPWWIPKLLVDPEGEWLRHVSAPGPQLITGMRGCGKTLLLRALQFHSRLIDAQAGANDDEVAARLREDGFMGLYVSCNRLLDGLGEPTENLHQPYARLFVSYVREAIQAIRHLREVDRQLVTPGYHQILGRVVAEYVDGSEQMGDVASEGLLDRHLQHALAALSQGSPEGALEANPAVAFPHLAEAIKSCSPVWSGSQVLFLLDDVSTRHLHADAIGELLSSLIFKDDQCAFKMTTEWQTLNFGIKSPGMIENARVDRDLDVFDLGREVNERLGLKKGGREFLSKILAQRAASFDGHPDRTPVELLGDATLVSIARNIAASEPRRQDRQGIYHGISALTAVCVGDIGDVISIYDSMLRLHRGAAGPIPDEIQSRCYQEYSARRLYHLSRREPFLRDAAFAFGRAAHELLVGSLARQNQRGGKGRLRQYTTLHVQLDPGKPDQRERLRQLIDAGVFVFEGGIGNPRQRARDRDPVNQFVLTYRKLFGISQFIGLAERDRFELSGADLDAWLDQPSKELLTERLGGGPPSGDDAEEEEDGVTEGVDEPTRLFELIDEPLSGNGSFGEAHTPAVEIADYGTPSRLLDRLPTVTELAAKDVKRLEIPSVVVGLGFEQRALTSARRVFAQGSREQALLVAYRETGKGPEIAAAASEAAGHIQEHPYDAGISELVLPPGPLLVDVTALTKSIIFHVVRAALLRDRRVVIAHTLAREHYPLNDELARHIEGIDGAHAALVAIEGVFSGDEEPYTYEKLLREGNEDSRRRLLCAGASAKHGRLLSLLDEREYDRLEILVPAHDSPRSRIAQHAAEVASGDIGSAEVHKVDTGDLRATMELLARSYHRWYGHEGFDVEFGLTGTKIQAVAAAALSTQLKIAQCWYVRPAGFDPARFSRGAGKTRYYSISLESL